LENLSLGSKDCSHSADNLAQSKPTYLKDNLFLFSFQEELYI
jgi:hypothetical protein